MNSTIEEIVRQATQQLADASPTARLDTEVLIMHVCNLSRTGLITQASHTPPPDQVQRLQELLTCRAQGVPIAYLTGQREFLSLDLQVTADVLIPRPETELLVEQALTHIPPGVRWTIADLGTGSGAVALAIAKERPHCRVIATDICETALAIAEANVVRLNIANVEFRHGNWLDPLAGQMLDMIVSNPPYIAEHDPHLTQGDVRFEPRAALVAGVDGLNAIRIIAAGAGTYLKPSGWLLLEHGHEQGLHVAQILRAHAYHGIHCHNDLARHERVTVCGSA